MWFWIGVFILVVGAIAAALATWQNMTGQWWLKLLGSVGASVCAVLVLLVVFWIITGVWTTYTSEPTTTQIVKETVVVEKVVQQTVVVKETVVVENIVIATPIPEGDGSSWTPNCSVLTAPSGGQIFWSNHRVSGNDPYAVVYDPKQGGSRDHPALGWYYQPCLPAAPDRKAHEVALVLRPGNYRFTGPECRVWHNWDGNHPWEQGTLLINRQNILSINIPATQGTNPAESWIAVKCATSWASGFSFEKLP